MGKLKNIQTRISTLTRSVVTRVQQHRERRRNNTNNSSNSHNINHRNSFATSLHSLLSRSREVLSQATSPSDSFRERMPGFLLSPGEMFSCCFSLGGGNSATTKDKIEVVQEHNGNGKLGLTDLTMIPELPQDLNEFEKAFLDFVDDLDLSGPCKTQMLGLPLEKKWQIYYSSKELPVLDSKVTLSPEYYVDRLSHLMPYDSLKLYDSLRLSLRTQPTSFVIKFLQLQGLELLLEQLKPENSYQIVKCVKSLMNNSKGREYFLRNEIFLNKISETIGYDCVKTKIDVFEILGAVCLVPGGWRKVLRVVEYLEQVFEERARFLTILNDLDRSTGPYKTSLALKTAIMSFLNALLNYGPGEESLEFRVHMRYELLSLGMAEILRKLRKYENETLDKHIEFFERVWMDDERELSSGSKELHLDPSSSPDAMFAHIKTSLCHSYEYKFFKNVLRQIAISTKDRGNLRLLSLLDKILTEIMLHRDLQSYEMNLLNIDMDTVISKLENEQVCDNLREEMDTVKNELTKLKHKLILKEDEIRDLMRETKEKDKEIKRVEDLLKEEKKKLCAQQQQLLLEQQQNRRAATDAGQNGTDMVSTNKTSLPMANVAPMIISNGTRSPPASTLSSPISGGGGPPPPPPPPLPPMGGGLGGPPPPPPPLAPIMATPQIVKSSPKSSTTLKSLNWHKLPNIQNTIWESIDESQIYKDLNLSMIDSLFSTSSSHNNNTGGGGVKQQAAVKSHVRGSIIDPRRAQNLNILLSKLKLSDEEICSTLATMEADKISPDMLEQLLKFLPSNEELTLLQEIQQEAEASSDPLMLPRADAFLWKLSRIEGYEQRLKTLFYMKKLELSFSDLKQKMKVISCTCKDLLRSKKLKKILEIVLALGNYMNRGVRGNCAGFRLTSLNKLKETKGVGGVNLMVFLAEEIWDKFFELSELETEIGRVKVAGKINVKELENDVKWAKNGVEGVARVYGPSSQEVVKVRVMVEEISDTWDNVTRELTKTTRSFGEPECEDFFQIFDEFLTTFNEALAEVKAKKLRSESDYANTTYSTSTIARGSGSGNKEKGGNNAALRRHSSSTTSTLEKNGTASKNGKKEEGEFDDLISALRTGDVFTDEVLKKRSNATRTKSRELGGSKSVLNESRERIH